MNLPQRIWSSFMMGIQAFNHRFFSSSEENAAVFESVSARLLRYQMGEAFYEGRQYHPLTGFSQGYKVDRGLYKYIQNIYNPARVIGDFYQGAIWGGNLDPDAGDSGAIPITVGKLADEAKLRAAIATGWLVSSWDTNKAIHILNGTILGDAAIYIRDDLEHGQARMEILNPGVITRAEIDIRGFVKSYEIKEKRTETGNKKEYTYKETCEHGESDDIIFRTYRDDVPYAWEGNVDKAGNARDSWIEKYGFVPLVLTQHINTGRAWGMAEISIGLFDKIAMIDDEASLLHDQIRKTIRPFKLANFKKGDSELGFSTADATTDNPKPGREQEDIVYVNRPDAAITPVVTLLDIANVSANIKQMYVDGLQNDLPELRGDIQSNVAEPTLLAARARVENKTILRRSNYNRGIVRGDQMLIAIGGMRGYEGFSGFGLESFKAGKLDHSVSPRPVFPETEDAKLDRKIKVWNTASDVAQKSNGAISAETVLLTLGYSQDELDKMPSLIRAKRQAEIGLEMLEAELLQVKAGTNRGGG